MTDWEFFKTYSLPWLYKLWLPSIVIIKDVEEDIEFKRHPEIAGYYCQQRNQILIKKEYDCVALRIHEYGHWFNERLFKLLEALWEFPWWGLGLRKLFIKQQK